MGLSYFEHVFMLLMIMQKKLNSDFTFVYYAFKILKNRFRFQLDRVMGILVITILFSGP